MFRFGTAEADVLISKENLSSAHFGIDISSMNNVGLVLLKYFWAFLIGELEEGMGFALG